MQEAWQQVRPKDFYRLATQKRLSNVDQYSIQQLYQPIIGPDATRLYQAWAIDLEMQHYQVGEPAIHAALLQRLVFSLPAFYEARSKLEGIGLLRTYLQKSAETSDFYYELQVPLSAEHFFQDDILRLLFLDAVGPVYFEQVVESLAFQQTRPAEGQEVTRKFLDVFQFSSTSLQSEAVRLEKAADRVQVVQTVEPSIRGSLFDWKAFCESVNTFLIQRTSLEAHRKQILVLHEMYQIDEWTMKKLVEENADIVTNQLNMKELEQSIQRTYARPRSLLASAETEVSPEMPQASESKSVAVRQKELEQQGFNDKEIALITASETYAPMEFLTSIREQYHGTVTYGEQNTVKRILAEMTLPKSVVNMLIHYVLIVKGLATLQANFTLTVANSWARDEIQSPEAAFQKIRQLNQQEKTGKRTSQANTQQNNGSYAASKKYGKAPRSTRKETLPEWAQENYQAPSQEQQDPQQTADQLKRLEERRNKLVQRQNGGEM